MAANQVAKPRIYINALEWLRHTNLIADLDPVFRTLPVVPKDITFALDIPSYADNLVSDYSNHAFMKPNPYIACLGNDNTVEFLDSTDAAITFSSGMVNANYGVSGYGISYLDGLSSTPAKVNGKVGSVLLGSYFDFPVSPDLRLSISYDFDGIKEVTTKGGSTITNANYTKPSGWGDGVGAWEFGGTSQNLSRVGRRIWKIKFSYLDADKIFSDEVSINDATGAISEQNMLSSNVILRILQLTDAQLPFIWQPNIDNNKVFAIAKFQNKSFQFNQVANNIFSFSATIKEIW